MLISCKSSIIQVTVHARGAVVTRRVEAADAPASPDGDIDLVVPSITLLAEGGSVRATVRESKRLVASVQTAIVLPEAPVNLGVPAARVRDLGHRLARLRAEDNMLVERRRVLGEMPLAPRIRSRDRDGRPKDAIAARVQDAIACADLLAQLSAEIDARRLALNDEIRRVKIELEGARVADAQSSTQDRAGDEVPTRSVTVRLGGTGPIGMLDITYVIPAARWWPVYTLRIEDGGKRAAWWFEAAVAQLSGENWTGVPLAFSTADVLYDARLPELASLRFGRAQNPVRRAYRPPPPGLERMFEGYDASFASLDGGRTETRAVTLRPQMQKYAPAKFSTVRDTGPFDEEGGDEDLEMTRTMMPKSYAASPPAVGAPPGAPQAAPERDVLFTSQGPASTRSSMASFGAAAGMLGEAVLASVVARGGGGAAYAEAPIPEPEIEPSDAWLDFDALALAPVGDFNHRGHLVPSAEPIAERATRDAVSRIGMVAEPLGACDPLSSRGMFDHRYEAGGRAEVPSDGRIHRLMVAQAEATPQLRWRTAPRELPDVFREAELTNPFGTPLLSGPVDVYAEGSLITTTQIHHVDRGGKITVGMGVDDRLRVARNVRSEEESAGLLGGSIAVVHTVTIDLTSSLGREATVEVVDRIPVTDDKAVEIKIVSMRPESEKYDQVDRDAPIRGGMRWRVALPPGGKSKVELVYRLIFASKHEIMGGNRRD